jgi:DNA invertase Pin-like site-specific DNA recombinase
MADQARRLLGYARILDPGDRESLSRQRGAIEAGCERSSWQLVDLVIEAPDAPPGLDRPGIREIFALLVDGQANGMIVAAAESLTLRVPTLVELIGWLGELGATLVSLEPRLDTGRKSGRSAAEIIAALVGAEREQERARHANRQALGKGRGRLAVSGDPELRRRITQMRGQGMTLQAIADKLNTEGIATVRDGALWRPSSVQAATGYRRPRPKPPPIPHRGPPGGAGKLPRPPRPGSRKP